MVQTAEVRGRSDPTFALDLSVANSYSRGDREFE